MTQVVQLAKVEKTKKQIKPKIEVVSPTHIADVWRLFRESLILGKQVYPDISEDSPEVLQDTLFQYLQNPLTTGLIARMGKKPVGMILGNVSQRPYGRPHRFLFVWVFWVEPQYRKSGIGSALWKDYSERLKRVGVGNFEATCQDHLAKELVREAGIKVQTLMTTIGGKL